MNFFKSVFSDDPDPPQSESASQIPDNAPQNKGQDSPDRDSSPVEHGSVVNSSPNASGAAGWNFGGLIRNLTVKSESIIETYRRDLQEFGTELKKEIEVAQGSLETVGHAFDEFGNSLVKGTAQIITHGKDAILALESDSDNNNINNQKFSGDKSLNSKAYSRFDAQVRAIQGDANTYCEEPDDLNDYNKWKSEFSLEGKQEEFESYLRENDDMESIYRKVVPGSVDHETFWCRYYYKVYRLKKAEELRARLVRTSLDDEDLSWDFEDDDGDKGFEVKAKSDLMNQKKIDGEVLGKSVDTELRVGSSSNSNKVGTNTSNVEESRHLGEEPTVERKDNSLRDKELGNKGDKSVDESKVEKAEVVHQVDDGSNVNIKEAGAESISEAQALVNKNGLPTESDSKLAVERKADDGKSSSKAAEEEDLGWDEIEDLSSIDDKKTTQSGSPNKVDLRKRLSAAEEDEDDDEKPAKP
ncbi:BSD domain-containing protein 1 isoform X2 [Neltuma alba]|uniref:BSD domain-containing protein 1 isoform X2 n=1 Tax=Neltuma alba TaxID=207710 RepID=UPI0010A3ED4D|nr:BSD domain-containing protein 1 isoform X2 [Prosopis alba]